MGMFDTIRLEKPLVCPACGHEEHRLQTKHVVIWHSVLVAVEKDREEAERKLAAVDRLDLIRWIEQAQNEAREWRGEFNALRDDLSRWHDYREQEGSRTEEGDAADGKRTWLDRLRMPDEEIRNAADPIAVILERHPLKDEVGWGD